MVILIGLIFLALGVSLAAAWWPAVVVFAQGALVLFLLGAGFLALIVGYSEMKARREYDTAIQPPPQDETQSATESAATANEAK